MFKIKRDISGSKGMWEHSALALNAHARHFSQNYTAWFLWASTSATSKPEIQQSKTPVEQGSRSTLTKLQAGAELKTPTSRNKSPCHSPTASSFFVRLKMRRNCSLQPYRHVHFHWSGIMKRNVRKYNKQTSKNNNRSYFVISLSRTGGLRLVLIWIKPVGQALPCILSLECE